MQSDYVVWGRVELRYFLGNDSTVLLTSPYSMIPIQLNMPSLSPLSNPSPRIAEIIT